MVEAAISFSPNVFLLMLLNIPNPEWPISQAFEKPNLLLNFLTTAYSLFQVFEGHFLYNVCIIKTKASFNFYAYHNLFLFSTIKKLSARNKKLLVCGRRLKRNATHLRRIKDSLRYKATQ